jgi:hypothetical protein
MKSELQLIDEARRLANAIATYLEWQSEQLRLKDERRKERFQRTFLRRQWRKTVENKPLL